MDQPVGTFLVRDSTTKSGYALAVKYVPFGDVCGSFILFSSLREANGVKRYLISYIPHSKKFRFGDSLYDSFDDLIRQYTETKTSACRLKQPAPKAVYIGLHNYTSQVMFLYFICFGS